MSGLLNPLGMPARVLDLLLDRHLVTLYDDRILAEYQRVLSRPRFSFAPPEVRALLDFIASEGELVLAPPVAVSLPDETDLPFLEVALAGRAEALVMGNRRDFLLEGEPLAQIYSPAELVRRWLRQV